MRTNTNSLFTFFGLRFSAMLSLLAVLTVMPMAYAAEADDARELIKTTADQVVAEVRANHAELKEDTNQLYVLINELIVPHVDFKRMSRWILGKHWRKASATQKAMFMEEFKKLLIKTYGTALLKFSNEEIVYLPNNEPVKKGKVTVRSEIRQANGQRFNVQYRMHNKDNAWKVYDISVDGVSLISTYRNSFSTKINQAGLDALNAELAEKNQNLTL